jgi:feruloyl-CoA synthase
MNSLVDRRPDGTLLVRSPQELGSYPERVTERLDHWAHHASYRTFLAQRDANGRWRNVTFAEAQYFARRIAQALIDRRLSIQNPLVILSGDDIETTLLGLAAAYAGIPHVLVPADYSLNSTDFEKLGYVFELVTPGMVFAADGSRFERAIQATKDARIELVVNESPLPGATMLADLVNTEPTEAFDHASSHVNGETVLKIDFLVEGPGGLPLGTIFTHRMSTSNQEMTRSYYRFLAEEPPVLVDLRGNAGVALYNGGSYYFDQLGNNFRNLRVVAPTVYWGTAEELKNLNATLDSDAAFRKHFNSRMKAVVTVGAEANFPSHVLLGDGPPPGVELKLVPATDGKFETRVKGPNVTWGYWRNLELTRNSIDEEGFFRTGMSVRCVDPAEPSKGFVF